MVLLGKGGGGTRLLSQLAIDAGVSLGSSLNASLDSLPLVNVVYGAVRRKLGHRIWYSPRTVESRLKIAAQAILSSIPPNERTHWGFKLPECVYLLPEVEAAFPGARYALVVRDPIFTSLRRTHITSRLDNPIGRATLPAAYRYCGLEPARIAADPIQVHNACAVAHQLNLLMDHVDGIQNGKARVFVTRFEDLVGHPATELSAFAAWLGRPISRTTLLDQQVDPARAAKSIDCPPDVLERITRIVQPTVARLRQLTGDRPDSP